MLTVQSRCDNIKCTNGEDGKPKTESFSGVNLIPNYKTIIRLLAKAGWTINDFCQFCCDKCEKEHQSECELNGHPPVIKKSDYTICPDCGKFWQPDYDAMREGK